MSYYCTQCGTRVINDDALFCHKCGAALAHAFEVVKPLDGQSPPVGSSSAFEVVKPLDGQSPPAGSSSAFEAVKPSESVQVVSAAEERPIKIKNPYFDDEEQEENTEESEKNQKGEGHLKEGAGAGSENGSEKESANETVAAAETEQLKPVSKETKRRKNPLIAVFGVLISMILFAAVTAGQAWFVLKDSINNQAVRAAARAVADEVDFAEISVPEFVNGNDVSIPGVVARTALPDAIYNTIDDYYREVFGVESNHIRELLQSDVFRKFLGEIIDNGVDYIMGEEGGVIITSDKIAELIEENKDEIEDITSYSLVESDLDDIKRVLGESGINSLTWDLATENTADTFLIRSAFSLVDRQPLISLVVIIAAVVILIILLAVLNRRHISNTLLYFGIPCMFSGGLFIAGRIIGADLISRWATREFGVSPVAMNAVTDAFSGTENVILYSGIIVAGAGLIAVIVRIILHGLRKKLII
ncbi:MAG: zinc ribbon domain-containing protein [Oscillospiraceae bacterium]|nr:zinc ribbon domain-containing protein [Oscillospiraceae bacterium]